jgi:hypothetical protein
MVGAYAAVKHLAGTNESSAACGERQHAIACGGIGLIHGMDKVLELARRINLSVSLFKFHLPYTESDHV